MAPVFLVSVRLALPVTHKSDPGTQRESSTPNMQEGISKVQVREQSE